MLKMLIFCLWWRWIILLFCTSIQNVHMIGLFVNCVFAMSVQTLFLVSSPFLLQLLLVLRLLLLLLERVMP